MEPRISLLGKETHMLVLSRQPDEEIVFPTLGITVRLLRINGKVARIGIQAPQGVPVLRQELVGQAPKGGPKPAQDQHALRNQLSCLNLALHLLQRQHQLGLKEDAEVTLARVQQLAKTLTEELTSQPPPAAGRKCRTLLVEDDPDQRELLAKLLQMHDCECATAADGLDCLDYLAHHEKPDIVLLDMGLPRCDGPQTVRHIRDNPDFRDLKVFSISGKSPQELGLATGPGGVDAWFSKPVNTQKLWEAMQQAVKGSRN
jgi:carbon storage regulator CsrA